MMVLNPFKEANLEDLQHSINKYLSEKYGQIEDYVRPRWYSFLKKAKERITVMLIPHSEKKIINFHVPIYAITLIISAVLITIIITSIAIVSHVSTIKDVSKLKMYGTNSKVQIAKYKEEINKLYDIFQKFKPEVTYLYSLTNEKDVDALWAKGGVPNPSSGDILQDISSPSIEELNIKEVEQELKTTKDVLIKIKSFLQARKKIIENTPSLWPAQGSIISKFGSRSSSFKSENEYNHGIEIAAFPGSEIRATAPGKVESIAWDGSLGLSISIKHKYGFTTVYSHCQRAAVEVDQNVSKGETIGYVGKTGKASRPMCYYQIRIGTDFVNPIPYINKISQ